MPTQLRLRRGTTAQHSTFTGASGEITVDTSKKTVVVHDGSTAGGVPLATEAAVNAKQNSDAELTTLAGMSANRATFLASSEGFGFRNRIINGDMRIDQRNAGASVTGGFAVDRFSTFLTYTSNLTYQRNAGSVTPPPGFTNYLGITTGTGRTVGAGDLGLWFQAIEGFNTSDLGWGTANAQTVTLSFWVRSSLTGTHSGSLLNDGDSRSYVFQFPISAANTWEYKTITIPGDTSGTWLTNNGKGIVVSFNVGSGSTLLTTAGSWNAAGRYGATGSVQLCATTGATFYITGVQLEAGSVATPFERRDYGRELIMCQRYFEAVRSPAVLPRADVGGTTRNAGVVYWKVQKRAAPTVAGSGWDYEGHHGSTPGILNQSVDSVRLEFGGSDYRAGGGLLFWSSLTAVSEL